MLTLTEPLSMLRTPFHSLQITGPPQGPRVHEPHPASIARTRPAVTGLRLERRCAGGVESSLCHRRAQQEVSPRYSQRE